MARGRATFVLGAALVTVAAAMLSQQVLYEWLVVPRLADVRHVPVAWWLGLAAPVILSALISGWMARHWDETLAAAALGAFGVQAYGQWLAQTGRPGWYKSFAVEAPLEYWTLGSLQLLLLIVVVASTGHACHKILRPS
jgi:hypothetical protein